MNIIRVTKTARNRVDVIFTGYQYLFFHADFGLVAVAERGQNAKQYENKFIFSGEHNKPQHTLPYIVNVKLEKR